MPSHIELEVLWSRSLRAAALRERGAYNHKLTGEVATLAALGFCLNHVPPRTSFAGRKLGAKWGLKAQQVWAIRLWLDRERRLRDRAMFDLAIDSKLRGCDIVKVKIGGLVSGGRIRSRVS